jgi:hypothetical protein
MVDWSSLERIPTRTLKLELEHFWISGSPWKASVLQAELERRERESIVSGIKDKATE